MKNLAGDYHCNEILPAELVRAGITPVHHCHQQPGEVPAHFTGELCGWTFRRLWYYWDARRETGLPIPQLTAAALHALFPDARVDGHCASRPARRDVCHYHVDTQDALIALAAVIRRVADQAEWTRQAVERAKKEAAHV